MICTDTDNYVNVLSTIKKERKKKKEKSIFDAVCKYKKTMSPINIICREDLFEDLKTCHHI